VVRHNHNSSKSNLRKLLSFVSRVYVSASHVPLAMKGLRKKSGMKIVRGYRYIW